MLHYLCNTRERERVILNEIKQKRDLRSNQHFLPDQDSLFWLSGTLIHWDAAEIQYFYFRVNTYGEYSQEARWQLI